MGVVSSNWLGHGLFSVLYMFKPFVSNSANRWEGVRSELSPIRNEPNRKWAMCTVVWHEIMVDHVLSYRVQQALGESSPAWREASTVLKLFHDLSVAPGLWDELDLEKQAEVLGGFELADGTCCDSEKRVQHCMANLHTKILDFWWVFVVFFQHKTVMYITCMFKVFSCLVLVLTHRYLYRYCWSRSRFNSLLYWNNIILFCIKYIFVWLCSSKTIYYYL